MVSGPAWARTVVITLGCFMADLTATAMLGRPLIFPALINYHALLWSCDSRLLQGISAATVVILGHLYGYWLYYELFFVIGAAASAFLLKHMVHTSLGVIFAFFCIFHVIHGSVFGLPIVWTGVAFFANILSSYSILKYHNIR
jgi:hypothetical protein